MIGDVIVDVTVDVLVVGDGPAARMADAVARRLGADVLRLPAAAVWAAFGASDIAAIIDGASVRICPAHLILAQSPARLPDGYPVPETTLARALGAAHDITAQGTLQTRTDADGRTSLPSVWSIPGTGTPRLARAQARLAVVQALGQGSNKGAKAQAALSRAIAREPVASDPAAPDLRTDAIACACEAVSVGRIRAAMAAGAQSVPAVKRATRAGMGACQGRLCGHILHALLGDHGTEARHVAPRGPIHPIKVAELMAPGDAHQEPIAAPGYNRWVTVAAPATAPGGADVVVIGAGVVGLCAALDLADAGRDVLLIDRAEPGLAASTANAGSLHVQLLPYDFEDGDPGPLGEALALGPRSIALWRELERRAGEGFGIRTEGGLVLAADAADLGWLSRKAAFERSRGIETAIIGANELATLAPALARGYAGAAFNPQEGQIDPLRGTMALIRLVRQAGVRVSAGLEVRAIEGDAAGWVVHTQAGAIRARQVLNAGGAHAGRIAGLAGVALPVRAVVQQVIATAPAPPMLRHLVAQARLHLSLKQKDAGQIVIGGGWPGTLDADGATRLLRGSIQGNLHTAAAVMPGLAEQSVVRAWTGLTVHLDRGPVLSATPGMPGLFHAVTANGYTLGPISGRLVAECMLGRGDAPAAFRL